MRRLTVVSVAYPLAPVGPDAVGGSEQILTALDRALVAAGHRSIVTRDRGLADCGRTDRLPGPAARPADRRRRHRRRSATGFTAPCSGCCSGPAST